MIRPERKHQNPTFNEPVKRALSFSREYAAEFGREAVQTEDLLLGLLNADDGSIGRILAALNTETRSIRQVMESKWPDLGSARVQPTSALPEVLPYCSRAKKVLEFAMAEAHENGSSVVSLGHLLLGLLREETATAAGLLKEQGIDLESARAALQSPGGGARSPDLPVEINDGASKPIYEQITAQIQEAIATSILTEGDQLPPVRILADRLEIAPGTVGRAYAELERLGFVVTRGARGTRVAERKQNILPNDDRPEILMRLLRPSVVAAFHIGASAAELEGALRRAMRDIFSQSEESGARE